MGEERVAGWWEAAEESSIQLFCDVEANLEPVNLCQGQMGPRASEWIDQIQRVNA